MDEAQANYEQGKTNLELARVTAQRWASLVGRGVVSKQENDQYQSQYQSQQSSVRSLEKAINAQKSNVAAAEANLARLQKMQSYLVVKAPFDGVITQRNVDIGALVNAGSTLLYRVAQMGTLRTYVNVPQANASSVHAGPDRAIHGGQPAWTAVHRHRGANLKFAGSLQPHAVGGGSGAE